MIRAFHLWRLPLVLRLALRDLRGGLGGFAVFLACIALGVAAISGVASLSRSLNDGLAAQGRVILGGDISFDLVQRPLSDAERAYFQVSGELSTVTILRAMARNAKDDAALVEIKAVDAEYPFIGAVQLDPAQDLGSALALRDGAYGLAAEATLADRLALKPGDLLHIGNQLFRLSAILTAEPDKLASGIGFGPRVLISDKALQATGLLLPGALVKWLNRVSLQHGQQLASDSELAQFVADTKKTFPQAGWEIRTRANISPQFSRNLERFTQFLTLIGLTSLIIGGVGVANAIRAYVERKTDTIAILKSLGASGSYIFVLMLSQVVLITGLGLAIGTAIGCALPFAAAAFFGPLLALPIMPSIYPTAMGTGCLYGLLTALVFSLPPLGKAHDVPAQALFRQGVEPARTRLRSRYMIMCFATGLALVALVIGFANESRLAFIYLGATLASFVILGTTATLIMAVSRRLPASKNVILRLAIANIYRPNALTPSVVVSLGLGLVLLVTLTLIDGSISAELSQAHQGKTPSFFFIGIESNEAQAFADFIKRAAPEGIFEAVPMLRGRIVKLRDTLAEDAHPKESAAWVLQGDRGITYSATLPEGTQLASGTWWPQDYAGPPLVSMESEVAQGLGLKIGDQITVNILGRDIVAGLANTRHVNWRGFGINFVLVFSPHGLDQAPHGDLATLTFSDSFEAGRDAEILRDVAQRFPSVTSIRVKEVLDAVNALFAQIANGIRAASSVALAASVLVLGGALASGQQARIHDAVILKTLGATRTKLLLSFIFEFGLIGLATAIFGLLAGWLAAYAIIVGIMQVDFLWVWPRAILVAALALGLTIFLGLLGSWRVLGRKPAAYLRNL